jgi:hypothetical protein
MTAASLPGIRRRSLHRRTRVSGELLYTDRVGGYIAPHTPGGCVGPAHSVFSFSHFFFLFCCFFLPFLIWFFNINIFWIWTFF